MNPSDHSDPAKGSDGNHSRSSAPSSPGHDLFYRVASVIVVLAIFALLVLSLRQTQLYETTYKCYDHAGANVENITADPRIEKGGYPVTDLWHVPGTPYYEWLSCYRPGDHPP